LGVGCGRASGPDLSKKVKMTENCQKCCFVGFGGCALGGASPPEKGMSRRGLSSYFRPPEGYRRTAAVQVFQRSQVARPDPDLGPTRLPSRERTALSSLAVASLRRSVAVSRYVKLGRAAPPMSTNLSPELSTFGGQLLRRTVRIYSRSPLSRQPRQNIIYTVAPRLRTLPGNPRCGGGRGPGRDLNSELPGSGFWGSKRGLPGGVPGGARGAPGGPPRGGPKTRKIPPENRWVSYSSTNICPDWESY